MSKPTTAEGYRPGVVIEARRLCLHVATILGDLLDDVVVVGGLVPHLIVDQEVAGEVHVGTRDLDLGLSLALLDDERYREIGARLRGQGFEPGRTREGRVTRQTWTAAHSSVTIDFLIPESDTGPKAGRLQSLEADFAAVVTPALPVAFADVMAVVLDGETLAGERARRTVSVCGPAAFVVMKAHALRLRGENKDAYDLVYVLEHFGSGTVAEVADRHRAIAASDAALRALEYLAEDFASIDHVGAVRAARFRTGRPDADRQAAAFSYVQEFLRRVRG